MIDIDQVIVEFDNYLDANSFDIIIDGVELIPSEVLKNMCHHKYLKRLDNFIYDNFEEVRGDNEIFYVRREV